MPISRQVKRIFNAGELSPKVYGRSDLDRWAGGVKTLLNFIPLPQGGVVERPGLEYIANAKNNNEEVRLIPFTFSTTQSYIIEAGNSYMRFYKDGGQILGANNAIYEIATSYNEDDLSGLQYTQSYDTLYLTHVNHNPAKLTRTAHNNWNLSNITFTSKPTSWDNNNGWPRTCAFYQDRLCFASTPLFPSRLYISKTSNYEDLTTGTNDSDAMVLNLLSGTSDVIFWLASAKSLVVGTDTGIQSIAAANGSNAALTPTNKRNYKESYYGTAEVIPVKLGDLIVHAASPASKVRELAYSWESDGFKSTELTILSDHLLEGYTVDQFAYQQNPNDIVWVLRNDGTLLALTYMQEQNVVGWSRHTSGNVVSIATIPGNQETELWAAVHRNINNNTVTFVERLKSFSQVAFNNSFFVDSGLSYSGNAIATITGLDHLNGNNVSYLADGVPGNNVVANNNLVLDASASNVQVGIQYTSDVELLDVDLETEQGQLMMSEKRIVNMQVLSRNSAGGTYGPNSNNQTELFANNAFTDGITPNLSVRGGYNPSRSVLIRQSDPLPMNIDAIGLEIEI